MSATLLLYHSSWIIVLECFLNYFSQYKLRISPSVFRSNKYHIDIFFSFNFYLSIIFWSDYLVLCLEIISVPLLSVLNWLSPLMLFLMSSRNNQQNTLGTLATKYYHLYHWAVSERWWRKCRVWSQKIWLWIPPHLLTIQVKWTSYF